MAAIFKYAHDNYCANRMQRSAAQAAAVKPNLHFSFVDFATFASVGFNFVALVVSVHDVHRVNAQ